MILSIYCKGIVHFTGISQGEWSGREWEIKGASLEMEISPPQIVCGRDKRFPCKEKSLFRA